MKTRKPFRRVLVLCNHVGEDVYERLKREGPRPLAFAGGEESIVVETVAEEMRAIVRGLREAGYTASMVNVEDDLDRLIGAVRKFRPDVVLNLIEIFRDDPIQESWVAGLIGLLGVPFTGAAPLCLATCQRKFRAKLILDAEGVPTPEYRLVEKLPVPRRLGLDYPLIVKPVREDASGGVSRESVVRRRAALEERVAWVLEEFKQPALIERYIDGREIHVSILGNDPPRVLPLMEILFSHAEGSPDPRILTFDAKWDPHSPDFYAVDTIVPPRRLPAGATKKIREASLRAYRSLGCRDYARVDLRLDAEGNPHVLEVNPNPDLASGTGFMACAEAAGYTLSAVLGELVEMAWARGPR